MTAVEDTFSMIALLNFQTFASVWYWLAVVVTWGVVSNYLVGVPFDVLFRARKLDAKHLADLEALIDINTRRIIELDKWVAMALTALVAFGLSVLVVLSFGYGLELAQGVLALAAPLTLILVMNIRLAHSLYETQLRGADLVKRLFRVRLVTHIIGGVALFLTSLFGMYAMITARFLF